MIGRLVDGRYQVRSRIARGGMATVYLATDLRLERRVAIKVMHGHLADDSQFKQRFIQEARSAARLAHPNVVNVFDQGQDNDSAYLVMEYLPGITLRDLLQEYGSLTPEQTIDITEAVLSGLAAAHKAGIVHRDLKPENVLLADDGRIKIGDFGLARAASANTATGAALLGTIAYLSPELVTRGIADTRSDIYAVGIMMYEMLTGEQPFKGEQPMQIAYQHANDTVPTPSTKNPKVPAELDELVLWATARDPEERPRDARGDARAAARDRVARSRPPLPHAATIAIAQPRWRCRRRRCRDRPTTRRRCSARAGSAPPPRRPRHPTATDATTRRSRDGRRAARRGLWLFALVLAARRPRRRRRLVLRRRPRRARDDPRRSWARSPEAARPRSEASVFEVDPTARRTTRRRAAGLVVEHRPRRRRASSTGSEVTINVSLGAETTPVPARRRACPRPTRARPLEADFTVARSESQQFDADDRRRAR